MRDPLAKIPVSARPLTIPIVPAAALRFVCAGLSLALVLLIARIFSQL